MKIDNKTIDDDFLQLESFLDLIDKKLVSINSEILKSSDPDSDGLCDNGEYILGFGFVAIQRYINAICCNKKAKKTEARNKGHKINKRTHLIEVLDAGANYFKHEPEWGIKVILGEPDQNGLYPILIDKSEERLERFQGNTLKKITKVTPYAEYTLSNLLAEINKGLSLECNLSFSPLLPFLANWRDELQ